MNIVERVDEFKRNQIKTYPCHVNRASDAGHECEAYLTYSRTNWQDKLPHDVGLQYVFDEGKLHEPEVLSLISKAGFQVIEQQRSFAWKEYNLTGHLDAKVVDPETGKAIPLEIKTMSPNIWGKINTIEDMKNSKYAYMRRYPAQIMIYMLLAESEKGVMILKNKTTGRLKQVDVALDYEYTESILKKLERINDNVAVGREGEKNIQEDVCSECPFRQICLPSRDFGKGIEIETNGLEKDIDRLNELKIYVTEYKELDAKIKAKIEGKEQLLAGHYYITGKWIERMMKAKEAYTSRYWKSTIIKNI